MPSCCPPKLLRRLNRRKIREKQRNKLLREHDIRITRIELVSKTKKRYTIHTDSSSAFDVCEDALIEFNLSKDKTLSQTELEQIGQFDDKIQCLQQAYRFLSRRPHLEKELYNKLLQKGYTKYVIAQSFTYLRSRGYLNDNDYIRMYIRDQSSLSKNGPLLIKKKLLEKGADAREIDHFMPDAYPEDQVLDNARNLLQKKLSALSKMKSSGRLPRIIRFMQQRGFDWETIQQVLAEMNDEIS